MHKLKQNINTDMLIVGGGIIGLAVAKELCDRWPDVKITMIEKESSFGAHASGRNSGVIHAGFYYTPDSLKAKFTILLNEKCQNGDGVNIVSTTNTAINIKYLINTAVLYAEKVA